MLQGFASGANHVYDASNCVGSGICELSTQLAPGQRMADANKFDAALNRFEHALERVEDALKDRRTIRTRLESLEVQTAAMLTERQRLDVDLEKVRTKAAELVDTSRQAVGKIDSAVSRIRSVLHSNS
jgi:predicted  nucleic acid-binding Zn-ribbon protein